MRYSSFFVCECFEISQDYSWKKLCLMLLFWLHLHSSCIEVETMKNPFSMKLWQTNKMESMWTSLTTSQGEACYPVKLSSFNLYC